MAAVAAEICWRKTVNKPHHEHWSAFWYLYVMDPKLVFFVGLSLPLVFMWYAVIYTNKMSNLSEKDVTLEAGNSSQSQIPECYDP
jgi:uncharacterized protein YktB (UPF0637 family)